MTSVFYKYYKEIKNRFFFVFFSWLICLSICYYYKEVLLFTIIYWTNLFVESNTKPYFIFTNIAEVFYVYFELSVFISNQVGLCMLFYQLIMFLSLGLYHFEFSRLKLVFQVFFISWGISICLLSMCIIPLSWSFFLGFQDNLTSAQPVLLYFEAKLAEYLSYFIQLYYICLTSCQFLAAILVLLTSLDEKLRKTKTFRKLFYLVFVVFSTIITPPDILSQICISCTLILIYELVLILKQIQANMVNH